MTAIVLSALLASPTGLQATACEPEAVPLAVAEPGPLADPDPVAAWPPSSTVRTPAPSSAPQ
ncbi:MAG TPA: hypothetical protein VK942_04595 [Actinomycetes bacterium]|nr:hypothetical protein [Actinomycetes bacterium]